jgi:IS30 family transposase
MKQKPYTRLSDDELDDIAEMYYQGARITHIAQKLGRAKSTISVCITHNKDTRGNGTFRATLAKRKRYERKQRQRKPVRLDTHHELLMEVYIGMVFLCRSPEQVAQRLKKEYPHRTDMHITAETIYEYIYVRARGTLRNDLVASLRRPQRHRGQRRRRATLQGTLPNILSIDERPQGVLSRRIPGHWESDLIIGKNHKSALISLVERKFRYLILIRITSLDAHTFASRVSHALNVLPAKLRKTMTHDNGKEIAKAFDIESATGVTVYVAHPRSPWERGTNENTNGLVREFFPKGTDFCTVSDDDVLYVQEMINSRPRKVLDWATPTEVLLESFG